MMHNMVFVGKNMREGFLEEILEGTNQIQCSNLHIDLMSRYDAANANQDEFDDEERKHGFQNCRTLAYKRKQDIEIWLSGEGKRETDFL